jgi:uncharacterized protein (TIRG00374 family)
MLFAALLYLIDFDQIGDGFSRIRLQNIYMACGFSGVALLLASVRWYLFVRAARFPHGFWVSVRVRLVAQLFNLVIPSGVVGDGLQVFLVSRRPRISGPLALATILADRLMALFSVAMVLLLTAWLLGDSMSDLVYGTIVSSGIGILVVAAVVFGSQKFKRLDQINGRLKPAIRFIAETLRAVGEFKDAYSTLLLSWGLAVIGILSNTAIAWVLLPGLAEVQFWQLVPTFCLVMLSAFVPATFSGMGVREWILFVNLKDYGLSLEEAVVLSLTLFAVLTLTAAFLAIVSAGYSMYRGESITWIRAIFRPVAIKF